MASGLANPVVSLVRWTGLPMAPSTGFANPDAIAVASLAADVGKFGVQEGRRAGARAVLRDLAARLDDGTLDWALLRDGINFAMEYPELARRLVPILLPWLDRAA